MSRNVYRIIDANFNRSREALRVIEEFCRFELNSALLTGRTKQLRHQLCTAISTIESARLITSRDTLGDVGVCVKVENQLCRSDLKDSLTAGCKRLTESLRVLAEMIQISNPSIAETIEKLRYDAYTLEKDIVIFSSTAEKFNSTRLYVIISSNLPINVISLANQCARGGGDCIQLRTEGIEDDKLFALAVEFVKICRDSGVLSIINNRVDIAIAAGADGVHLGQTDLPIEQARKLQLTPLIIGKTTHSLEQLQSACRDGATYVSLGPVFASATKPLAQPVGIDYVKQGTEELANTGVGHAAIGGVTISNLEEVLAAGARTIAVCSAITGSGEPAVSCRLFKEKIEAFSKS